MKYYSVRVRYLSAGTVVELGVIRAQDLPSAQIKAAASVKVYDNNKVIYVSELTALDLKLRALIIQRREPIPARLHNLYNHRLSRQ